MKEKPLLFLFLSEELEHKKIHYPVQIYKS